MIQLHSRNVRAVIDPNFALYVCEKSLRIVNVLLGGKLEVYAEFTGFATMRTALIKFFSVFPEGKVGYSLSEFRMFIDDEAVPDMCVIFTPEGMPADITEKFEPFSEGIRSVDGHSLMVIPDANERHQLKKEHA